MSESPRPSVRELWSAWMSEIDAYYCGVRGWGLVLVLGGAVGVGWSLDQQAVQLGPAFAGVRVIGNARITVPPPEANTGSLVMDGTLALPLACSVLAVVLLLASQRRLGRILAAFCAIGALAAVSVVAFRPDENLLGGFHLFWIATGAIALGACLCNVTPRVLARRGPTDDSFPA